MKLSCFLISAVLAQLWLGVCSPAQEVAPPRDALRTIESTRGGRHWIDQPTPSALSPMESQARFEIEAGLRIELVAAEPMVIDPVAIEFDRAGRMFVAEYSDYPVGPADPEDAPLSRIVMLIDEDGDGQMDQRWVYADHLDFCHSLMPYRGGILACTQHEILFLKDNDGDHVADYRETLFTGFSPAHSQMQIGNPRWGLDNWIYFNHGPGQVRRVGSSNRTHANSRDHDPPLAMPRKEFRFHPVTEAFGPASGLGQFGNTIDNFGNRFFSTNRNPIMSAPIDYQTLRRNPYLLAPKDHYDVAPSGGASRVFPLVEMKSNYLSHAGTHTAACGTTAYRGDLLGGSFADNVFVCEPIGHLITRSLIRSDGAILKAERAHPDSDFLASTDTWFRPASLATGPDGALYIADMYRLWVEHPKFMPPEIAERIDWRAGDDRGRIWRVVPESIANPPDPFQPPTTNQQLLEMLADTNGWRRQLAQRLLVENQDQAVVPNLRELLKHSPSEFGRLHALWTLDGLNGITTADLLVALNDSSAVVRRHAVSLAAVALDRDDDVFARISQLVRDPDPSVRFAVALALGESSRLKSNDLLAELSLRDGNDPWFATAIMTSVGDRSAAVCEKLLNFSDIGFGHRSLIQQLASNVGHRGDLDELESLFALIERLFANDRRQELETISWQPLILTTGLAEGLVRHRGALGKTSLSKLLAGPPEAISIDVESLRQLIRTAGLIAVNNSKSLDTRLAAIDLARFGEPEFAQRLPELLTFGQPVEIQLAALNAIGNNPDRETIQLLTDRWSILGPRVRPAAMSILLRRNESTLLTLQAIEAGNIPAGLIDIDRRVRLLRHADLEIRSLAERLLGGAVSSDRQSVAKQYAKALTLTGSPAAGQKVFANSCAKCHQLNGSGLSVGPDISDVRNRSREALLYEILDPNQRIDPQYTAYLIQTIDGRMFSGLMIDETPTAIALKLADGKTQTILRDEIEQFKASQKSLMPEGIEKEISVQQMADLLAFLK